MALLPIIVAPDPRLKRRSEPVAEIDAEIRTLMDDMLETMYAAPGIGLAAPQIGVTKRIIVVDAVGPSLPPAPMRMANPEIVWASDDIVTREEGCLSFPEQFAELERPARVRVRYMDEHGAVQEREVSEMLATCIQHEIDHLDGVLLVDHLSSLKRGMILRKLAKARKLAAS